MGANSVRSPRVAGRFPVRCPASPTACPSHEEWRLAERQPPSLALKGSPRGSRPAPEASLRFIRAQTAGGGTRAAFGRRSIPAEPPPHRENWASPPVLPVGVRRSRGFHHRLLPRRLAALIVAFPSEYSRYSSRFAPPPPGELGQPGAAPTGRNAHARVLPPTPPARKAASAFEALEADERDSVRGLRPRCRLKPAFQAASAVLPGPRSVTQPSRIFTATGPLSVTRSICGTPHSPE